jgi:MFS family permease
MLATYRALAGNGVLLRLFAGEFISGIGDWLYLVALLVVVYRVSDDPLVLGIVGGARIIPYILLSVVAGVIVDRYDRRIVLIASGLIRGAAMVGLTVATIVNAPVWIIVALAIFATCFAVFFRPAIGAYIPSLVRNENELGPANSLFATLGEISFIIGPAVGGLIIAASDLALAFAINAATFVVVAAVYTTLPSSRPSAARAPTPAAAREETATTSAEAAASPDAQAAAEPVPPAERVTFRSILRPISGLVLLDLVGGFMYGGLSVVIVILAVNRLHGGEQATGYLSAALGVGGVVGAVISSVVALRPNLAPALIVGAAVLGGGFIFLGLTDVLLLAMLAVAIAAAGSLIADVVNTTIFQRVVPDEMRGRTLGGWQTASTLTYAAGSFLMPLILVGVGAQVIFPIGGAAIIATSFVTLVMVGPHFRRAVDAAAATLLRVSRLPVFAGVSPAALEVASGKLLPMDIAAGTVVIREGDPADRFYIIESGQFAVDQLDPGTGVARRLRVMGADEIFGELGLMHNAPRSATVSAVTGGRLLALEGPDFLELLNAGPEVSSRMLDRYRVTAAPPS